MTDPILSFVSAAIGANPPGLPVLAQTKSLLPLLGWLGLAIAIVLVAGSAMILYRRRVLSQEGRDSQAGLMDNLREMRNQGQITPEEYDAAKRAMVARLQGRTPTPAPRPASERVAPPGFDLTGAPLPRPPRGPAPS